MAKQPTPPAPYFPPCPECGGACLPAATFPGTFSVQRIGALLGGRSRMRAVVCTRCGLTRLYALNPRAVAPRRWRR
jgi:hypothetical protein